MSLEKVVNVLAGRPKSYDILDREIPSALQIHAEDRMAEIYGSVGNQTSSDWRDIEQEMRKGPGTLTHEDERHDFAEGLSTIPRQSNIPQGKTYNVGGNTYSIFYFEPSTTAAVVEETDETRFLASPYILGETLEFSDMNDGLTNYTFAELRKPKEPLRTPLERHEAHVE